MSSIVCNCNSYFNIDYGMPILFTTPDYRTSNDVGLKYICPHYQEFYNINIPQTNRGPLFEYKQQLYQTQNARTYDEKYRKWDSNGKPNLPLPVAKTHYMSTVKEKMFKNPPAPRKFDILEYKEEFCLKQGEAPQENIKNVEKEAVCQISSIGRGEQPRIKIEEQGVMKHLDAYVTTTQMSYVPFSKDKLYNVKNKPLTFYGTETCPELKLIKIKKPINDETKFKKVIQDRIVPTLVYRVPFSGKKSEYTSNYRSPTTGCFSNQIFHSSVEFEDSLSNPSKWQTLAAPNMYCTEYCHIGTGRSVKTAVNIKEEKCNITHDYCK